MTVETARVAVRDWVKKPRPRWHYALTGWRLIAVGCMMVIVEVLCLSWLLERNLHMGIIFLVVIAVAIPVAIGLSYALMGLFTWIAWAWDHTVGRVKRWLMS